MKYTLRTKLTLTYILIATVCVFLISIISNIYLDKYFQDYIMRSQVRKNNEVVSLITQQYEGSGKWNICSIQSIGINALENGMIVKVQDADGKVIWDAMRYNTLACHSMMASLEYNMYSRYPNWQGEYVKNTYPIVDKGETVGNIEIVYYGPFYYTDSDLEFINTLNEVFIGVGIISLLLAIIIGAIISRNISKPIIRVIDRARLISQGHYSSRSDEESDTKEINDLINSINDLARNLESQERLRKQLTADVAHELRTPLATLQSHMEAMIDGVWNADTERLKSCHEEILRLNRLVGDLDKLAKYESGALTLDKTEFNLKELVKRVVGNFEKEFLSKNIQLELKLDEQIIKADRDKISQMIVNLISNALKYTNTGGKVIIELTGDKNKAELAVIDNGIGIAKEDLPYIFERFYRADKSRTRLTGGAGIGLAITKAIVEAHKGTIEVESEINVGTKFKVILPKNNEEI